MKPHSKSRDFFLYILVIIALFSSVVSFLVMLFSYIDISYPSALDTYTFHGSKIRTSISTLLVMFPVFLSLSWMLRKELAEAPERAELGIRKFLLHLTLFVMAVTIIVDLIVLINSFLDGDLTTRFVLKVGTVLVTAAGVFLYYLWDLRGDVGRKPSKVLAVGVSIIVVGSIISGFFIVGSPLKQRNLRLDEERVRHLQDINMRISDFYRAKQTLPLKLSDIENDFNYFKAPTDPETKQLYEYRVLDSLSYELCANFVHASDAGVDKRDPIYYGGEFTHTSGRNCFTKKIDPAFYQPYDGFAPPVRPDPSPMG